MNDRLDQLIARAVPLWADFARRSAAEVDRNRLVGLALESNGTVRVAILERELAAQHFEAFAGDAGAEETARIRAASLPMGLAAVLTERSLETRRVVLCLDATVHHPATHPIGRHFARGGDGVLVAPTTAGLRIVAAPAGEA